ncbi:MAG: Ca-activated chloride channel family protein [Crocinitomicaceae bacterium]|jgi:Ca-activated chloride channel family protein
MKREEYKGQFDSFETPTGMWENIEKGLDEKKKKRVGLIWWKVAAGLLILVGAGFAFTLIGEVNIEPKNRTVAHNGKDPKRNVKPGTNADTLNKEQLGAKTGYHDSLRKVENGNDGIQFTVKEKSIDQNPLNGLSNITTAVPYTSNGWTGNTTPNMFGFGGGSGSNGSTSTQQYYVQGSKAHSSNTMISQGYFSSPRNPSRQGYAPASQNNYMWQDDSGSKLLYRNVTEEENIGRLNYRKKALKQYADTILLGEFDIDLTDEFVPQKRIIPYEKLREANPLWLYDNESMHSSYYDPFIENQYLNVTEDPLSTFSIDVDGASYSDVRGMINRAELPNPDAVRIEEFVNYFPYDYEEPTGKHPFSIQSEVGSCPWNPQHQLMKVAIKGRSIEKESLPTNNLVFLIDVSGSMAQPEKLEILKKGFKLLINELREEDHVSICVYAGAAGVVLQPTSGQNKDLILDALLNLTAGGSTAGGEGIELAYALAEEHFDNEGNNRIILATDGDFNVGISNDDALIKLIEKKRETGVFLTVLGVGHDNYQSSKMEKLANNGNGNFSYIDNILEAKKVFVTEMGATLQTIAKDVKIQMEFNPTLVSKYRLIGYENRMLQNQDFANDAIDAGELGAGHTVTAVYEIIPFGVEDKSSIESDLKYSTVNYTANSLYSSEMATMKFRYKEPTGTESILIEKAILKESGSTSTQDFRFTQAVIEFGLILRQSEFMGASSFESVLTNAKTGMGKDPFGYRSEFIRLVEKSRLLWGN